MMLNEAAEAYFESAKLKVKANKIKDAIQDLTKAIELDPIILCIMRNEAVSEVIIWPHRRKIIKPPTPTLIMQ